MHLIRGRGSAGPSWPSYTSVCVTSSSGWSADQGWCADFKYVRCDTLEYHTLRMCARAKKWKHADESSHDWQHQHAGYGIFPHDTFELFLLTSDMQHISRPSRWQMQWVFCALQFPFNWLYYYVGVSDSVTSFLVQLMIVPVVRLKH